MGSSNISLFTRNNTLGLGNGDFGENVKFQENFESVEKPVQIFTHIN